VPLEGPADGKTALTAWRAATLGSLIVWDLASASCSALLLTLLAWGEALYRPVFLAGWALGGILLLLALARRLDWRARAIAFLAVNYGVVVLSSASFHPTAVAFAQAVTLVALTGLLLGGRAATAAAALVTATLSLVAFAATSGWLAPRPRLAPPLEWVVALVGGFPPIVMVVIALRRIADRLKDALESAVVSLRELETTRSHLADSERAELAGRLAGALAHDLNNTLTVVIAGAEWLTEQIQDPEQAEAATQICEAARSASSLTQQVLLASRPGMSQPRTLDLARVTILAAGALRRLLPHDIRVETRADGPVWTTFDPGQIQQIVLTLALNARAAMPGGGTLLLAVRPGGAAPPPPGEPPPAAILEVSDTGFGMDAEERRRAFEPWPVPGPRRGAGFGLAHVKAMVEAGGGHALLRSRPGTGTTVTLTLPGSLPLPPAEAQSPPHRSARVLVVEDDIRVRALVCTALSEAGNEVSEVADGTQAMRAIEELSPIDLLVTDVVLPGTPIGEVISTFRARHPRGKVLVCSGFSDDEALRHRVLAGEYGLVKKPFTRSDLMAEVRRLLAEAVGAEAPSGVPRAVARV